MFICFLKVTQLIMVNPEFRNRTYVYIETLVMRHMTIAVNTHSHSMSTAHLLASRPSSRNEIITLEVTKYRFS